jgi:hypothetical protein
MMLERPGNRDSDSHSKLAFAEAAVTVNTSDSDSTELNMIEVITAGADS